MSDEGFYEEDEPIEDLLEAYWRGTQRHTREPLMIHVDAPMVVLDTITPDGRMWMTPDHRFRYWRDLPLPIVPIPGSHHALDAKIETVQIRDGVVWVGCDVRATANGVRYLAAFELGALRLSAEFTGDTVETYRATGGGTRYSTITLLTEWRLRGATFVRADSPDPRLPLPKISWPDC